MIIKKYPTIPEHNKTISVSITYGNQYVSNKSLKLDKEIYQVPTQNTREPTVLIKNFKKWNKYI